MVTLEAMGEGILFGLLLSALIGPVFFKLLQTSLGKGFYAGASMALGVAASDVLYVVVASLGVSYLIEQASFRIWLGWIGGSILLIFGLSNLLKQVKARAPLQEELEKSSLLKEMLHGFMLNGINPFVLLFWFSLASMIRLEFNYTPDLRFTFFGTILGTVLLLDLFKVYLANKLRRFISVAFMRWMNRIVGLALCGFSLRLFWYAIQNSLWYQH